MILRIYFKFSFKDLHDNVEHFEILEWKLIMRV